MDYTNNIVLFCLVVGMDIVVGLSLIAILVFSDVPKNWSNLSKFGMLVVVAGIFGQAYYLLVGYHLDNPAHDQIWILKDLGIAIWTLSLGFRWLDSIFQTEK